MPGRPALHCEVDIMTTEMTVYQFKQYPIRIHRDEQSNPWFFTEDIAKPLGLQHIHMQVKRLLDDDEKDYLTICAGIAGNPRRSIVSESGLYKLILRSTKPKAKSFQNWVTREVLPSIRKTGTYSVPGFDPSEKMVTMLCNSIAIQWLLR
jgi:anti-repressor protein